MPLQRGQRVLADRSRRQAGGVSDAAQQVGGEFGNILAALAEGRYAQRHDVQAMEQLLAETAGGDLVRQRPRRRGEHPDIDLDARLAAVAGIGLLLQHPRQPALQSQRQIADFLEHQRAAMRQLESTRDVQRIAVSLAIGAEQLEFEALGRQG